MAAPFKPSSLQLSWIKRVLFLLALLPLARLIWLGMHDALTANPIEFITRSTGTWALVMLMLTLSITPLRMLTGVAWPVQLRRMLGLFMFFYALLHFSIYLWLDHWFDLMAIGKDIAEHPYVLVGFTSFVLSIPLAATSNSAMIRRLKTRWKTLHLLVYPIAILGVLHFWWLVKKDVSEPLVYVLVLAALLGVRLWYRYRPASQAASRKPLPTRMPKAG
ncbi:sulfoxide reductase heme-binding subunit YedZ [Pseudomethylobacillus aquaticus]|uniref:Protein-methionine-sulfoxide reductase heme-binding subunit MsrQ n=1 Tax=Pseudomethylobacillus aquaticus TaxID=2676064 RepID=A0A3N0V5K7_9PROT|nr:protein-methionine-sulfoxide reductase heme-binding subunit MsrQ [Pseudomethylobacillus aquaticus]ROH88076.1 sulfoxide reductase heme-binding subunit YedZ [Pseudomethylobacillus aquaticus]